MYPIDHWASSTYLRKLIQSGLISQCILDLYTLATTTPKIFALIHNHDSKQELAEVTGLQGGQLYHLRELIHSGLVSQESRNLYTLTKNAGVPAYLR